MEFSAGYIAGIMSAVVLVGFGIVIGVLYLTKEPGPEDGGK